MLVLTRKKNEVIQIGEDVIVTVVRVQGNSVRLGIEAPEDVRVLRGECAIRELIAALEPEAEFPEAERDSQPFPDVRDGQLVVTS